MKRFPFQAIGIILAAAIFSTILILHSTTARGQEASGPGGFAVLELFTSEGCSSCPPADALVAKIRNEAGNKPIYVLAYHVDYWNRLGWKDIFSDAGYSKRQKEYARQLGADVYTPQLVVNGQAECIGSDEVAVDKAVNNALKGHSDVTLKLEGTQAGGVLRLHYGITGRAGGSQLVVALVQKDAVSVVKAGENQGRTLSHAQIVRGLYSFDVKGGLQGDEVVSLPAGFNAKEWAVIGMVQDGETRVIRAADEMK